eukprot:CAMPEP_0119280156 /NCGR_PEP_ID=MMETSP1329-20130426/22150_1 /TAXON_ID=114041 /ORGANISM="Genus nov. species nov., Strain RCC1024" /LENGTH=95 /DNA_ID=CAMNT_0007280731 /DNA_START=81 /DNA_END=365 /DNA_ORIENTATION=+
MPRLPQTATSMEPGEPSLGRHVFDDVSDKVGMVVEVRFGGWRTVLLESGERLNRRSGALEYASGEPTEGMKAKAQAEGVAYAPYAGKKVVSRRKQ